MGIQVEYNNDLALRHIDEHRAGRRLYEECIPENLSTGQVIAFLKEGRRVYDMLKEIPLYQTDGNGHFSRILASVEIKSVEHVVKNGEVWTKGAYEIKAVDTLESRVHFEGVEPVIILPQENPEQPNG